MTDQQHTINVLKGDIAKIESKLMAVQMSSIACVRQADIALMREWRDTLSARVSALEADNV